MPLVRSWRRYAIQPDPSATITLRSDENKHVHTDFEALIAQVYPTNDITVEIESAGNTVALYVRNSRPLSEPMRDQDGDTAAGEATGTLRTGLFKPRELRDMTFAALLDSTADGYQGSITLSGKTGIGETGSTVSQVYSIYRSNTAPTEWTMPALTRGLCGGWNIERFLGDSANWTIQSQPGSRFTILRDNVTGYARLVPVGTGDGESGYMSAAPSAFSAAETVVLVNGSTSATHTLEISPLANYFMVAPMPNAATADNGQTATADTFTSFAPTGNQINYHCETNGKVNGGGVILMKGNYTPGGQTITAYIRNSAVPAGGAMSALPTLGRVGAPYANGTFFPNLTAGQPVEIAPEWFTWRSEEPVSAEITGLVWDIRFYDRTDANVGWRFSDIKCAKFLHQNQSSGAIQMMMADHCWSPGNSTASSNAVWTVGRQGATGLADNRIFLIANELGGLIQAGGRKGIQLWGNRIATKTAVTAAQNGSDTMNWIVVNDAPTTEPSMFAFNDFTDKTGPSDPTHMDQTQFLTASTTVIADGSYTAPFIFGNGMRWGLGRELDAPISPVNVTASVSGSVLTVSALTTPSQTILDGMYISPQSGIPYGAYISDQLTGTAGKTGTYQLAGTITPFSSAVIDLATLPAEMQLSNGQMWFCHDVRSGLLIRWLMRGNILAGMSAHGWTLANPDTNTSVINNDLFFDHFVTRPAASNGIPAMSPEALATGYTASFATNVMTVTSINADNVGAVTTNNYVVRSGVTPGTTIVGQLTATALRRGTYTLSANVGTLTSRAITVNGVAATASFSGTTMTVTVAAAGNLAIGGTVAGSGITGSPTILSQDTISNGGEGTYELSTTPGTIASGFTVDTWYPGYAITNVDFGNNVCETSGIDLSSLWGVTPATTGTLFGLDTDPTTGLPSLMEAPYCGPKARSLRDWWAATRQKSGASLTVGSNAYTAAQLEPGNQIIDWQAVWPEFFP